MTAKLLGEACVPALRRMAARRWGVTVCEVAEEFEVGYRTAHRFVQRMVRDGLLKRTDLRRRRTEVFEKVHGAGGIVYKAAGDSSGRRRQEDEEWDYSRNKQGRRR